MKKGLILLTLFLAGTFQLLAQNLRVSGSNGHSVIICSNGNVFAWGSNTEGQLGLNAVLGPYSETFSTKPQRVYGLGEIFQIDAGSGGHNLALTCDGKVFAWGRDDYGQLGDGHKDVKQSTPTLVKGVLGNGDLSGVSYVSGGNDESFAILSTKELVAWGQNDKGQLGNGSSVDSPYPTYVKINSSTNLKNVIMVEAGDENGYALVDPDGDGAGTVYSWGDPGTAADNNLGIALGRPITNNMFAQPVQKEGGGNLDNIIAISAGDRHCLAIDKDGYLWAWGGDWGTGQVGDGFGTGDYYTQVFATKVVAGELATTSANWKKEYLGGPSNPVVSIAAGQAHSAAVLKDGTVITWGSNGFFNCGNGCSTPAGQLGVGPSLNTTASYGSNTGVNTAPMIGRTSTGPLKNVSEVSDGDAWTFAITKDGKIYVAGTNQRGELGLSNTVNQYYFTELTIPNCGITPPCPEPKLPEDFKACAGFTQLLSSGIVYPGFEVRFYNDSKLKYKEKIADPLDGGKPKEVTFLADTFGVWRVEVEDLRPATDRPCLPCSLGGDEVNITFNAPDFEDPKNVRYCGTIVENAHIKTTLPKNKDNKYVWYGSASDTKILGRTTGGDSTQFAFDKVITKVNPLDSSITLWVADSTLYKGTVYKKTESCDPTFLKGNVNYTPNNSSVDPNNQQRFVAYNPITLTELKIAYQVQVYDAGKTLSGTLNFGVYKAKLDNQGNPIADQASSLGTIQVPVSYTNTGSQDFTGEATVKLNIPIPGNASGYYFFISPVKVGVTNWGGNTTNGAIKLGLADCGQSGQPVPKKDDLTGKIILFDGMSQNFQNNQTGQNIKGGHFYDIKFEKRAEYVCGRIPIKVKKLCPPCASPSKIRVVNRKSATDSTIVGQVLSTGLLPTAVDTIKVCQGANVELGIYGDWKKLDSTAIKKKYFWSLTDPKGNIIDSVTIISKTNSKKVTTGDTLVKRTVKLNAVFPKKNGGLYFFRLANDTCSLSHKFYLKIDTMPVAAIVKGDYSYCKGEKGVILKGADPKVPATTPIKYRWYSNKADSTTKTYSTIQFPANLFKGDTSYRLSVTNGTCIARSPFVAVTVDPLPVFTAISADKKPYCEGDDVTLSTTVSPAKTIEWSSSLGGPFNLHTGTPYKFTGVKSDDITKGTLFVVQAKTDSGCVAIDTVRAFIYPIPEKPVLSNDGPKCGNVGVKITLKTTQDFAGHTFKWTGPAGAIFKLDSNDTKKDAVLTTPVSGDYSLVVTNTAGCKSLTEKTTVTIKPVPSAPAIGGNKVVCSEDKDVIYNVTNTLGSTYSWRVSNPTANSIGTGTTNQTKVTFRTNSTTSPLKDTIYVKETAGGCTSIESKYPVEIKNFNVVAVTVNNKERSICKGDTIQFAATATNGGSNPVYKWYVNGSPVTGAANKFTSTSQDGLTSTLKDSAIVKVELTSDVACPKNNPATDTTLYIRVVDKLVPKVTIKQPDTLCVNATVYIPVKGESAGNKPIYQWYKGGSKFGGAFVEDPIFSWDTTKLVNGDELFVEITSTSTCVDPDHKTAKSDPVKINMVDSASAPSFSGLAINETCDSKFVFSYNPVTLKAKETKTFKVLKGVEALPSPGKNVVDNNDGTVTLNGLIPDSVATLTLTTSTGKFCPARTASVDVKRLGALPTPGAGTDDTICATGSTSISLAGTLKDKFNKDYTKTDVTNKWYSRNTNAKIDNPDLKNTIATPTGAAIFPAGNYDFIYEVSNAKCSLRDTKTVVVQPDVVLNQFNPDKYPTCDTEYDLTPLTPATPIGKGEWKWLQTSHSYPYVPGSNKIVFKSDPFGNDRLVKMVWNVQNGKCPVKKDTLYIVKNGSVTIPTIKYFEKGHEADSSNISGEIVNLCAHKEYSLWVNANLKSNENGAWSKVNGSSVTLPSFNLKQYFLDSTNLTKTNPASTVLKYTVTVDDPLGCPPVERQVTFVVNDRPDDPKPILGKDPVCAGEDNIVYEIKADTTANFYHWSNPGGGINLDTTKLLNFVNVTFGNQTPVILSVRSENACGLSKLSSTKSITVIPSVIPSVTIKGDSIYCYNDIANILVDSTVNGGSAPLFQWYRHPNPEGGNSKAIDLSDLRNRDSIYVVMYSNKECLDKTIVDNAGGVKSNAFILNVKPKPVVRITTNSDPVGEACEGALVEFVTKPVQGNFANAAYQWYKNSKPLSLSVPGPIYDDSLLVDGDEIVVEVTSNVDCADGPVKDTVTMKIIPNVLVTAEIELSDDTICEGQPMPKFIAKGQNHGNALKHGTYTWYLNGNVFSRDSAYTNAPEFPFGPLDVKLEVTSGLKCVSNPGGMASDTDTLIINYTPSADIKGKSTICADGGLGSSTVLKADSINSDWKYVWTKDANQVGSNPTLTVDDAAQYSLMVTTKEGCSSLFPANKVVGNFKFDQIKISRPGGMIKCVGDSIELFVNAQTDPAVLYKWNLNSQVKKNTQKNGVVALDSGRYTVTLTKYLVESVPGMGDTLTCTATEDTLVESVPRPAPKIMANDTVLCQGQSYIFNIKDTVSSFTGTLTLFVNGIRTSDETVPVTATRTGIYTVQADNNYCKTFSDPVSITFDVLPVADAGPDIYIQEGEAALLVGGFDKNAGYYAWSSLDGKADTLIDQPNEQAPVATVSGLKQTAPFKLTVWSINGICPKSDSMIVYVERLIHPWNSFSPNGDGIYETWNIDRIDEFPNALVEVYNRWGNLVWMTKGYKNGDPKRSWNGSNFRNGDLLPVATYYFIIYPNGGKVNTPVTGAVTIVK